MATAATGHALTCIHLYSTLPADHSAKFAIARHTSTLMGGYSRTRVVFEMTTLSTRRSVFLLFSS